MGWISILLFLLLAAPVKAGARLQWEAGRLQGAVGVMVWGVRKQLTLRSTRGPDGKLLLSAAFQEKDVPLPPRMRRTGRGVKLLGLMLRSNGSDAALRRLVRVDTCELFLRLGGQDAAALALSAGFLRAAASLLPFLRFCCVPVLGGKTAVRAACIAEARLGILLAALLWIKREERKDKKQKRAECSVQHPD